MSEKIRKVLLKLGCKGCFEINRLDDIRYIVYVNSGYFGIYDVSRETFVD